MKSEFDEALESELEQAIPQIRGLTQREFANCGDGIIDE
jgi:hypothetical protein